MTKNDKYFTLFYKIFCFSVLNKSSSIVLVKITTKTPRNLSITVGFEESYFVYMLFIHLVNKFGVSCGDFNPSRSETAFYSVADGFYI